MDDELIAAAELGEQARKFLESDLGRMLVGLADQEADLAQELLSTVNPTDTTKITELQNQVKVGRWFTQWLNELVLEGDQSLQVFRQQQESNE